MQPRECVNCLLDRIRFNTHGVCYMIIRFYYYAKTSIDFLLLSLGVEPFSHSTTRVYRNPLHVYMIKLSHHMQLREVRSSV